MPGSVPVEEPAPGVALLTISNPEKRGALDRALLEALVAALDRLDARCVVLTGEGRAFCAGYDIEELLREGYDDGAESGHPFPAALAAIEAYPYPVLAALNGATIGGGLELAIACDLRIAADTVQLGMPPAKLGVVYATAGLNRFLTTIGAARTRELFLTGRRIDAATAERWGLVNEVVEAEALSGAALALANEIAANAPLSLRGNRHPRARRRRRRARRRHRRRARRRAPDRVRVGGPARGPARVRRETRAGVARAVSRAVRGQACLSGSRSRPPACRRPSPRRGSASSRAASRRGR
jgi:enoyl-CoA hydratase/carnithine racemase